MGCRWMMFRISRLFPQPCKVPPPRRRFDIPCLHYYKMCTRIRPLYRLILLLIGRRGILILQRRGCRRQGGHALSYEFSCRRLLLLLLPRKRRVRRRLFRGRVVEVVGHRTGRGRNIIRHGRCRHHKGKIPRGRQGGGTLAGGCRGLVTPRRHCRWHLLQQGM